MTPLEIEIQKILLKHSLSLALKGSKLRGKALRQVVQEFMKEVGI